MFEYLKIAFRNIWRNKRRSLITMSSIFFAAFLAIVMRSFQLGSYDAMINTMVEKYTGHIQIEHPDFPEDMTLDNAVVYSDELLQKVRKVENVKAVAPRISSFSMAYSDIQNKGILINGIDPKAEEGMTGFSEQIAMVKLTDEAIAKIKAAGAPPFLQEALDEYRGKYYARDKILAFEMNLQSDDDIEKWLPVIKKHAFYPSQNLTEKDDGLLIGSGLSNYLKLNVGDSIIMLGMGYHGASAAKVFPIRGVIVVPNPQLDAMIAYGCLQTVQDYFSAYEFADSDNELGEKIPLLSSYVINVNKTDYESIQETRDAIIRSLNNKNLLIRGWKEANKELNNQIKSDNETGKIMIGLLYIVIAFGVFGTVLMMIAERKREMGVMIAIGMKKRKLAILISLEMFFMSFMGLIAGMLASMPIIALGHLRPIRLKGEMAEMMATYGMEPVMPMAWFDMYYFNQMLVVFIVVLVIMIYPVIRIRRMNVIEALRG
jgi:ABC-type lipoprotein release transport system permease subunit